MTINYWCQSKSISMWLAIGSALALCAFLKWWISQYFLLLMIKTATLLSRIGKKCVTIVTPWAMNRKDLQLNKLSKNGCCKIHLSRARSNVRPRKWSRPTNDPQIVPQMIPGPEMIPRLYHKWSRTGNGRLAIKFENVRTQEFGQWVWNLCNRFFMTVKLRKPWTFGFDFKSLIWYGTNHYKVQDTRENLKTTTNRPRSIYQYSNIDPRLSGQNWNFFKLPLSFNSQKRLGYKENTTKHRILSWKPRSHVRTLIYRTWPITAGVCGFVFSRLISFFLAAQ